MASYNFCFPVKELANERVKITPFAPSVHASRFFALSAKHPELYTHIPRGPYATEQDLVSGLEVYLGGNPTWMLFAVIDKTGPPTAEDAEGTLAGVIGYINSSVDHLLTEVGMAITLPPFQRTHVTSNAVGLMMQYALDPVEKGGLGLRRLQWQANSINAASRHVAEKMGFQFEGIMRWERVFRDAVKNVKASNGKDVPKGANEQHLGRDTAMYAMCWDDWENGGRKKVEEMMRRK